MVDDGSNLVTTDGLEPAKHENHVAPLSIVVRFVIWPTNQKKQITSDVNVVKQLTRLV